VTPRGPFQPPPFCDSVIQWYWTCATASSRATSYSTRSAGETLRDSSGSSDSAAQRQERKLKGARGSQVGWDTAQPKRRKGPGWRAAGLALPSAVRGDRGHSPKGKLGRGAVVHPIVLLYWAKSCECNYCCTTQC